MSNFKSDNPDPAKGTPASGTPASEKSELLTKLTKVPHADCKVVVVVAAVFQRIDVNLTKGKAPQKIDPETKEAGIFATCLASLCCCFAAEAVVLNDDPT